MKFVDWNWLSYNDPLLSKEMKQQQIRLLYPTGLCEGADGVEFTFVPTIRMQQLEELILESYEKLQVEENQVALCNEVFYTAKIEGAKTTLARTQEIHNGAPLDRDNYFSECMIRNGFRATKYMNVIGNKISEKSLLAVWEIIVEEACANEGIRGTKFRSGNIQVGTHVGLGASFIEDAIHCWLDYVNSKELEEHPFIKAALIHFVFEFIHPFCDGNGRTGRLMMNNFLIGQGFEKLKAVSFSRTIEQARWGYDYAFSLGDNVQSDCTFFIQWMLNIFARTLLELVEENKQ